MILSKPAVSHRRIVQLIVPAIALLFAAASSAQEEAAKRLSLESLMGYYRTGDVQAIDRAMRAGRARLTGAAAADPKRRVLATIFFREGVSARRLAELATANRLDVTDTDAKALGPSNGETYTVLTRHPGGVPTELAAQLRAAEATAASVDADHSLRAHASREESKSNLLYFSAKVLGSQGDLAIVAAASETLTVSIDEDSEDAIRQLDDARRSNSSDPGFRSQVVPR